MTVRRVCLPPQRGVRLRRKQLRCILNTHNMEDTIFLFEFDLCSFRHGGEVPLWRLVIIYFGPFQASYSGKAYHNNVEIECFHAHTAAGWILHSIDDDNINYILRLLMTSML